MARTYKYKGFYIIDNRNSYDISDNRNSCDINNNQCQCESNLDNKRWYIMLNNTPIYFSSLKESRKWCKDNYLLGIFYGWTKG